MEIDDSVEIVVQTLLQIPSCLVEKPIKYGLHGMVWQLSLFVLDELILIVHTYKFVTLQGSVCGSAGSCMHISLVHIQNMQFFYM